MLSPAEVVAAICKVMDGGIHVSSLVSEAIVGRLGHADQAQQPSGLDLLSDREFEVFQLIGRGMNSREIGAETQLGTSTVNSYRARIKVKPGVRKTLPRSITAPRSGSPSAGCSDTKAAGFHAVAFSATRNIFSAGLHMTRGVP